jgi:hypothetical protein
MPKAKLTTRQETTTQVTSDNLNKGSELSFAEADSNFINLRDASFGIADDSSTVLQVTDDKTITIAGGTNTTTALSGDTLTINATGDNGDLSIDTYYNSSFAVNTVRLQVPGSHDLELNAGTGSGPGGSGDRLIHIYDRINFHNTLESDGANGNINLVPNGNGLVQFYTGATAGYTFPVADASAGGKVLVLGSHDGSSLKSLSFATVDSLVTTSTFTGDITFTGSTMISPSNADITLDPSGTGEINLNATTRFNTNYKEDIETLTSATTIAVDCDLASVFKVTLAHSATFNFNNLDTGQSVSLIITQDVTGNRTGSFTGVLFPGNQHTLSTGGGDIDIITVFNDGTNKLGNISKDYS